MGPFQEYEEKKHSRSCIPRLVLHPLQSKEKGSPPESPFSEEEGISTDHSKRTISTNSFCSDDTGCPTSQSVSPSKTPAGSDHSHHASPPPPDHRTKVKRVRVMADRNPKDIPQPRNKREQRPSPLPKGSELDFSSSSSTGSLKRELLTHSSTGKKASSCRGGTHIRSLPFKPAGSHTANRDAELYAPYRTPPKVPPSSSTTSSSNSSPSSRRANLGRYHSCGDYHGIRPPQPEQYLTPLQQKEVTIRRLKSKLRESENLIKDRESEIEELKGQLGRMREDWIEEECHRVEAQLSLKEARKEIKQLRQVVETMRNSLMEKDKGIHKYFIDINIQNRKLESLLHSMELAQSGSTLQDELAMDFVHDGSPSTDQAPSPVQTSGLGEKQAKRVLETGGVEEEQGGEEMADSGLLVSDELASHTDPLEQSHTDPLEQVLMSTAMEGSQLGMRLGAGVSTLLLHSGGDDEPPATTTTTSLCSSFPAPSRATPEEKAVQTELVYIPPDLKALLLQLLKLPGENVVDALLPASCVLLGLPAPATISPPVLSESPGLSGLCCLEPVEHLEAPTGPQVPEPPRFMQELDFSVGEGEELCQAPRMGVVSKRYWSSSFLVDLVALAAPVLPTVAWLYSRHGVDGGAPIYNIGALIRGCCIMGLRSLRRATDV